MIADKVNEFADRISETAQPIAVIVAEARDLAKVCAGLEKQLEENHGRSVDEREKEIADRDAKIAELTAQLGQQ